MTIILVEDDRRVSDFLERGLRAEGHAVRLARTGPDGLALITAGGADVVILDVMLPGTSGIDVCHEARAAGNHMPILMLTAMDAVDDKVAGLRMGADDYMTKPFSFEELLARLDALQRRAGRPHAPPVVLEVAGLTLNRETLEVRRHGRPIDFTAKELALLELLMSKPGKVFSRARILNTVWGLSTDPLTNVVDVYISRLRAKLDTSGPSGLIVTVRSAGYKIDPGPAPDSTGGSRRPADPA